MRENIEQREREKNSSKIIVTFPLQTDTILRRENGKENY
jgi:hypothetical protein